MALLVKELLEAEELKALNLRLVSGEGGLAREIESPRIQKPGLLLTGLLEELHSDRVQILGAAEIGFLRSLSQEDLKRAVGVLEKNHLPAIIITKGQAPPDFLVEFSGKKDIPLFVTPLSSSSLIEVITEFLEDRLAPTMTIHGVCVDVLGMGIIMIGKSGIGKSECALDLVSRGYRLVSDDVVLVKRMPPGILIGTSADLTRYYMEIRGLGVVNIQDLFGITAIRAKKQMDLVIELVKWEPFGEYERFGLDEAAFDILGVKLPYLKVPVSPGRSIASIVEVAARNQILKIMGKYSSRALEAELESAIKESAIKEAGKVKS